MRIDLRLSLHVVLLCLPLAAALALGVRFLAYDVPRIAESEHRSVVLRYREKLDELKDNPATVWGDFSASPSNLFVRAQPRAKEVWGYWDRPRAEGGGTVLWRQDGDRKAGCEVPTVREFDYAPVLTAASALVLLLMSVSTFFGIRYFVTYVKSRDDFLAATAHDLKTPLVGLRYAIGRADADAKRLVERMLRLVANITDFLRLGGRRAPAKSEPVDLLAAYGEAYALFRDDYRDLFGGADVAVEKSSDGPFVARADETRTVQILWNLLGNDLKYAAPDGSVRARLSADGAFVRIEFVDEGRGMSSAERRRAFDRYYRAKTVLESGKGGFGIGLCTAREFAREMGGSLTVRANEPRGCVFTLSLPRDTAGDAGRISNEHSN